MNRVEVSFEEAEPPPLPDRTASFAGAVLDRLGKHNWELSILFCNDSYIRALNKQYRKRDEATDVLSFTLGTFDGNRYLAGDIAISLDTARENAEQFGISAGEELCRLLVHGILHLDGMDHSTNNTEEPMLILQEKLLQELADRSIMDNGQQQ